MIAIGEHKVLRLAVMTALYVAQGIPYGVVTVTLAAYLTTHGASAGDVGDLAAFALLPWSFKWLWAPLVDRFSHSQMGRRRPWIVFAQGMLVTGTIVLIFAPTDDLELLGWLVFSCNVFASLQDVSVDALAVDLLPEGERGFANGLMYGGSYLGTMFGGALLSIIVGTHGLRTGLIVQSIALAAIASLPLLLRERSGDKLFSLRAKPRTGLPRAAAEVTGFAALRAWFASGLLGRLVKAFSRRSPLLALVLAITILLGSQTITAILTALLTKQLGWTQEQYGLMMGGFPLLFGLTGSVFGGWLADRVGHKRMVAAASVLLGALWIVFGLATSLWPDTTFIYAYTCAQELLLGTLSASLFALLMGVSWPAVAASQFTAFMALLNLGRTLGAKLAGTFEDLGARSTYLAIGAFQIALVLILIPIDPQQNRRELGED